MQDKLEKIFEIQKRINKDLLNLTPDEKQIRTQKFILAATGELYELLSEINWAEWKKKKEVVNTNVWEEITDIFKFLLNLCLIWGLDPETFMHEFERKSMVVEQRLKQMEALKQIKARATKVCAIDLDGVLIQYPEYWIQYINEVKGTKFVTLFDIKKTISNDEYLKLKHQYREQGYKLKAPIYKGASKFVQKLKDMGYSIVILTKRPYKKYFRLFADTKINLDNNKIYYDAIVFDDEKHKIIVREFPQLEFMVEDNKTIANEVGNWGYKCFLMDNIYNHGDTTENVIRVQSFESIIKIIGSDVCWNALK